MKKKENEVYKKRKMNMLGEVTSSRIVHIRSLHFFYINGFWSFICWFHFKFNNVPFLEKYSHGDC